MPYRKALIRTYRSENDKLLFALAKSVFGERSAWHDRRALDVLESDTVFVAELEGSPAGYVAVEHADEAVVIEQLFVNPAREGEGIGRQLLEYAEGYAISGGARSLQIVVESDNCRALTFYRARGFVPIGGERLELILPQR